MAKSSLARAVALLHFLPPSLRRRATTLLFNAQVHFAGTAGLRFESLNSDEAVVTIGNGRAVQNHIGGVHAAAMALLAETATGAVFGMNLPADRLPLLKSMRIDYRRRAHGGLRARAWLGDAERTRLAQAPRGDLVVPVTITDRDGETPLLAELCWAWIPRDGK